MPEEGRWVEHSKIGLYLYFPTVSRPSNTSGNWLTSLQRRIRSESEQKTKCHEKEDQVRRVIPSLLGEQVSEISSGSGKAS